MDMSSMDMSMSDSSSFVITNSSLARSYWYITAGIIGCCMLLRILNQIQSRIRLRTARSRCVLYPTKPQNLFMQIYVTATAIYREAISPELYFDHPWISWLSPPPLGQSLAIAIYWAIIVYMLCWESIVSDAYYWERIGFRAAWVSITQVPLVYLLSSKSSIIGFLSGSSHERLNWLHRWVSRTLLVTVSIHGSFFLREWVNSGDIGTQSFVSFELWLMPIVKYGIGAWFILVWTFLSSLTPLRRLSYELFVLQHLAAAAVFLWLLWVHVPSYAQYNIWFAIAAVALDKISLLCWSLSENVKPRALRKTTGVKQKVIGHHAELRVVDEETLVVFIKGVSFKWRPGQHIYLRLPAIGPFESHPFTIANSYNRSLSSPTSNIQVVIQKQSGFTRRLHRKVNANTGEIPVSFTAIIAGPFGCPPMWNSFETLVLISASTGASFTMPILESVLLKRGNTCVSKIDVLMIARRRSGIDAYIVQLNKAIATAKSVGLSLSVTIAVTGKSETDLADITSRRKSTEGVLLEPCQCRAETDSLSDFISEEKEDNEKQLSSRENETAICRCGINVDTFIYTCGRPDIATFIRQPVEASGGETSVVVCGGDSLVAVVRNNVASLSDERAVHKGTGAQGIHLHTEHYCF